MKEVAIIDDLIPIEQGLNSIIDNYHNIIDIPENGDVIKVLKTGKNNVLYRVRPNTNVTSTCVVNTIYSFYVIVGCYILGFDPYDNIFYNSFLDRKFSGKWQPVCKYIQTLEQLLLSDEDMSNTDFVSNLMLINNSLAGYAKLGIYFNSTTTYPNLFSSVINQLKLNGFDFTSVAASLGLTFMIERLSGAYGQAKITIIIDGDTEKRQTEFVAYYNRDGSTMRFYNFKSNSNWIQQFTTLTQLGIDDATQMSDTEFAANIDLLTQRTLGTPFTLLLQLGNSLNISKSIAAKFLRDTGLTFTPEGQSTMKFERVTAGSNNPLKIELYLEAFRNDTYVCYCNRDGTTTKETPFMKTTYQYKTLTNNDIVLLNGYEYHNEGIRILKSGNIVYLNAILMKGTRTSGTTIFNLPAGYRPINKSISIPVQIHYRTLENKLENAFLAIQTNGNCNLYNAAGSLETENIIIEGSFIVG